MEKKKEPIGFKTPSMQIQEEYEEILTQLKSKKANWEKLFATYDEMFDRDSTDVEDVLKSFDKEKTYESLMELEHCVLAEQHSLILLTVARVGKELAECDVRIAAVEKALKDLQRGLK